MKSVMTLVFFLLIVINSSFGQSKSSREAPTVKLPEGISIADGKLQAKKGYYFQIAADGKSAQLINEKRNSATGGTFVCACGEILGNGSCSVTILASELICSGSCTCQFRTIISGVKYAVDFLKGNLKKVE